MLCVKCLKENAKYFFQLVSEDGVITERGPYCLDHSKEVIGVVYRWEKGHVYVGKRYS